MTGDLLQSIVIPQDLFLYPTTWWNNNFSFSYMNDINCYFNSIVHALKSAGKCAVPKLPVDCLKEY